MKKYILILFVLISGVMFAQIPDSLFIHLHRVAFTNGYTGTDSLQSYGTTHYSDSTRYVDLRYNYSEVLNITVIDTGTFVKDSLQLFKGVIQMDDNGVVVDTVWGTSPLSLKDNLLFANVNTLVGAGLTKTYILLDWTVGLLKIVRTNVVRKADNVCKIIIEGIKR